MAEWIPNISEERFDGICFPRIDESPHSCGHKVVHKVGSRGLQVLLVEDDVEVRAVVERFVCALGGIPTCRTTAEQALTALAKEVAAGWPSLPIILMSGYSSELLAAETALPLLRKPLSQRELAERISAALAS